MIAGIDQQDPVAIVDCDTCRLASGYAYRIDASIFAAVEIRDLMLAQVQVANRTVICIRDEKVIAVSSNSKRMLQAGGAKISIHPTEVEKTRPDQSRDCGIVAHCDGAHC